MALRAILEIEEKWVRCVIDTGAAVSVITDKLRKKLGLEITGESKLKCTIANGKKISAIGQTKMTIYFDELEMEITIDVIESTQDDVILGNDIWSEVNAKIDYEKKIMEITEQGQKIQIPVEYEKLEQKEESDEEIDDEEMDNFK